MPEKSNTIYRAEFVRKDSALGIYAWLRDIDYIDTSYHRTAEEQNELFTAGYSQCDGYNKKSFHQLWRAKDIGILEEDGKVIYKDIPQATLDKYEILGIFWESLGGRWGGNFKNFRDIFHFEY